MPTGPDRKCSTAIGCYKKELEWITNEPIALEQSEQSFMLAVIKKN